jgi:hypothetical protein
MTRINTSNPHSVASVNAKSGPRVGNQGLTGKRDELAARRGQAAALSNTIAAAYGAREELSPETTFNNDGSIAPTVKPRKFKK